MGLGRIVAAVLARGLTLLLATGLPCPAAVPLNQLVHKGWTTREGLPQATLNALARTPDGYLWLGTQAGLVRFDGARFAVYGRTRVRALQNDYVSALKATPDGALWIGTSEGLVRYRDGAFSVLAEDGRFGRVNAVLDQGGLLWVGGTRGLFQVGPAHEIRAVASLATLGVTSLRGQGSHLWVGSSRGLFRLEDGRAVLQKDVPHVPVGDVALDAAGRLWVASQDGLYRSEGDGFRKVLGAERLGGSWPRSLWADGRGNLWVGTSGRGLFRLDGRGRLEGLGPSHGFSGQITQLLEDGPGRLWVATRGGRGLHCLEEGAFTSIGVAQGLREPQVRCLAPALDGGLWIGTSGGGLYHQGPRGLRSLDRRDGLPSDDILTVHEDARHGLCVGTTSGLYQRFRGRARRWGLAEGLNPEGVRAIQAWGEALLLGTDQGLFVLRAGRVSPVPGAEGFGRINDVRVEADGRVWISSSSGLHRIEGDRIRSFGVEQGLPSRRVTRAFGEQGRLWVATRGGLALWTGEGFRNWTEQDGLLWHDLFSVEADDRGNLWLSSNHGLQRVAIQDLLSHRPGGPGVVTVRYGREDGMVDSECNGGNGGASCRLPDGRLGFATLAGAVLVDPVRLSAGSQPPVVRLESMTVNGASWPLEGRIQLPPRLKWLEFSMVGISLGEGHRVEHRYLLEGFDSQWNHLGAGRSLRYTGLPPRSYRLRMAARLQGGAWVEGPPLDFEVSPAFHQTWSFRGGLGVLLLGLGAGLQNCRNRALRRRAAWLEARVAESTVEIREQNAELARLNEAKNQLLGIAAHDLRNPIGAIRGYAYLITTQDPSQSQEDAEVILRLANESLELLDSLLDVSRLERERASLNLQPLDLLPILEQVLEVHRIRAQEKGIPLRLEARPDCPPVLADSMALKEVLHNLISNALKFTPPQSPGRPVWLRLEPDFIEVRDHGPGFTQEDMARVFSHFARLSARPTGGERSNGLGLSIVKELVEAMGGSLHLQSQPGEGASFRIHLQRA